jgi:hypothetical protein
MNRTRDLDQKASDPGDPSIDFRTVEFGICSASALPKALKSTATLYLPGTLIIETPSRR